jgi:hypothetical protein
MSRKISIILTGYLLAFACIACAASSDLYISTSAILLTAAPGKVINGNFYIAADPLISQPINLDGSIKSWFLLNENRLITLNSWLSVSPSKLSVKPAEKQTIHYRVTVPDAAQGFLMAMITYQIIPSSGVMRSEESSSNAAMTETDDVLDTKKKEIPLVYSIPLYVLVEGRINPLCAVIEASGEYAAGTLTLRVLIENTGNVFIRPARIQAQIADTSGSVIGLSDIKNYLPLFPKKKRTYHSAINIPALVEGVYTLTVTMQSVYPTCSISDLVIFEPQNNMFQYSKPPEEMP